MRAGRSERLRHHALSPRSTMVAWLSLLDNGVATAAVARRMRRKEESIFKEMLERW